MTLAIVAGGSAGIGQSAAVQIAKRGSGVILTYRSHPEGAEETVARIKKDGGTAVALPLDMGRSETFPEFRDAVVRTLADTWHEDSFTYLLNNAGMSKTAMFADTTEELFDEMQRVLLKGPYFLTQTLLPLLSDGGAIVNTTSTTTQSTGVSAGYSAYATMKGGLVVQTRYLAKELSARGIRVNSVSPGPTRTRLGGDAFAKFPEIIPGLAAGIALGRIGEPEDVGKVIAFLLSGDAGWITAQDIEVSGGVNL